MAKLTAAEQRELEELEREFNPQSQQSQQAVGLTPEEAQELMELEIEFGGENTDQMAEARELGKQAIREKTEQQKEKIRLTANTPMEKFQRDAGAFLMGAGQMMNPLSAVTEKIAGKELRDAQQVAPMALNVGRGAGLVGGAAVPASAGANLGVKAAAIQGAKYGAGVSGVNAALKPEADLGSVATEAAMGGVVGGAMGATVAGVAKGASSLINKTKSQYQTAAAREISQIGAEKQKELAQAAKMLGADEMKLNEDLVKLEQGKDLSSNSPLSNFWTLLKNKTLDGAKDSSEVDRNILRLATNGQDEIAMGVRQIPKGTKVDVVMDDILQPSLNQNVDDAYALTGAELKEMFTQSVKSSGLSQRAKQVLLSEGKQRLDPTEVQQLQRTLQNELSSYYKMKNRDPQPGDKLLADVRNRLAQSLEEMGGPGVREGNQKVHAALNAREWLDRNVKDIQGPGILMKMYNRAANALTPTGLKTSPIRGALDVAKSDASIGKLANINAPGPTKVRLARTTDAVAQFLNQPQVVQMLGPKGASMAADYLNSPKEMQEQMLPQIAAMTAESGLVEIDPPSSGFASEVNGKLTSPTDVIAAGQKLWQRSDLSILEKSKLWKELNKNGTVPKSQVHSSGDLIVEDENQRLIRITEDGSYGI